jgi:hypothetical protein
MAKAPKAAAVRWSLLASAAVAAAVGVALVLYRANYHNWLWEGDPARLTACGRTYERSGHVRQAELEKLGPLYPLFRAPPVVGSEVYSLFSASGRARLRKQDGSESPCAGLGIYMRDSRNSYTAYALLGGP